MENKTAAGGGGEGFYIARQKSFCFCFCFCFPFFPFFPPFFLFFHSFFSFLFLRVQCGICMPHHSPRTSYDMCLLICGGARTRPRPPPYPAPLCTHSGADLCYQGASRSCPCCSDPRTAGRPTIRSDSPLCSRRIMLAVEAYPVVLFPRAHARVGERVRERSTTAQRTWTYIGR